MRPIARTIFLGASSLLVAGVVVQVFLAGLGVFDSPTQFEVHRTFGYTIELLSLVMAVAAAAGRVGRRLIGLSVLIFGLFLLQSILILAGDATPMIAALHPVNGFLIALLAVYVAREAWRGREAAASAT